MQNQVIEALGGWEGYRVGAIDTREAEGDSGGKEVWIELLCLDASSFVCGGCGDSCRQVHDYSERWIRDLPILGAETWLSVRRRRVVCPSCGIRIEDLPWLDPYARMTRRFIEYVTKLCELLPIKHVADLLGLSWSTVKELDKKRLKAVVPDLEDQDFEVLAMDEFAIQKGHRYATVILNPLNRQVLWVGRGRSREDIRPFFEALGPERCARIKAVAMDMSASYALELRDHCPNAEVVYDLFHVVAKYGREVIDRVRVDEANKLRGNRKARKVIKGARWLLLRNWANLKRSKDRVRLQELLEANKALLKVYLLKDDLKHLWNYKYAGAAERFWKQWYDRAIRSRIDPLKAFARKLKDYLPGILAHARWPLHTSVLEGVNNKIKVLKRSAYGFRDDEYFFLKIRAAFPGIPR